LFGAVRRFYSQNSRPKARLFEAMRHALPPYSADHGPQRVACAITARA